MALFNHAVTWLRKNRVLLPGVSAPALRPFRDPGTVEDDADAED